MRKPIFAANWKMHYGPHDAREFMRSFLRSYPRHPDRTVIFFPPAITFSAVAESVGERPDILLGVQNIHWEDKGAFTGETSAPIARDAGARVALVGHSERRHVFGETDDEVGRKCAAAARAGLLPLLCVGETLAQREAGETESIVLRHLRAGTARLEPSQVATMVIAYEPVWAIGTGKTARPEDATAMHALIRETLREMGGTRLSDPPILYGGSVNVRNAPALLSAAGVDGLLVGGASLDADGWAKIVRT